MNNIYVRRVDKLPPKVKGLVAVDCDGYYYILVNESLCDDSQAKTVEHELYHILKNHFNSYDSVEDNENETNKMCLITAKQIIMDYIEQSV